MPYHIKFDFDCENEPPKVEIADEDGCSVLEVFEEPILSSPDNQWSWEHDDWKPGPFAVKLLGSTSRTSRFWVTNLDFITSARRSAAKRGSTGRLTKCKVETNDSHSR